MESYEIKSDQPGPEAPAESGDLLAGKYTSQEELEKGTLELLKKNGQLEEFYKSLESGKLTPEGWNTPSTDNEPGEETPDNKAAPDNNPSDTSQAREETKNVLEQNGLNIEDFEQEFAQNGELSEESYSKLQEFFPKNVVDGYIEGQKALAERTTNELLNEAGGQENFNAMVQWASENLSEQDINYFNETIQSGDLTKAKWAINALAAQHQRATGNQPQQKTPNLISGNNPSQGSVSGYQSKQEMIRDMQDSKYQSDPAFRAQVEEKLKRTTVF